jgi:signal transduction histidine kinase
MLIYLFLILYISYEEPQQRAGQDFAEQFRQTRECYYQQNYPCAEENLLTILRYPSLPDTVRLKALADLGKVYFRQKKFETLDSVNQILLGVASDKVEAHRSYKLEALTLMSIVAYNNGQWKEALAFTDRIIALAKEYEEWDSYRVGVVNKTTMLWNVGEVDECVELLLKARDILWRQKQWQGVVEVDRYLAVTYLIYDNYQYTNDTSVVFYLNESVHLAKEHALYRNYLESAVELANYYTVREDRDRLAHTIGLLDSTLQTAQLKLWEGKQKEYYTSKLVLSLLDSNFSASKQYVDSLLRYVELKNGLIKAENWALARNLGKYYLLMNNLPEAKKMFRAVLKSVNQRGDPNTYIKHFALLGLSKVFEQEEKYDSAFISLKQANALRDSLNNNTTARELARAETQLNILQKDYELIKKQKMNYLLIGGLLFLLLSLLLLYYLYRKDKAYANNLLRLNNELSESYARLERTQKQLVASERLNSFGELYAGLAHEINNPLAYVSANLDLVVSEYGEVIKPIQDEFNVIRSGVQRVSKLIAQLKGFAFNSKNVIEENLSLAIKNVCSLVKGTTNCDFQLQLDEEISMNMTAGHFGQVMLNLLKNAIAASDNNGLILVRLFENDSKVFCEVEDFGRGIEEELVEVVFEPFYTTHGEAGLGLGLSVTRTILDFYDGKISAHSKGVGLGAIFRVELPKVT